MGSTFQNKPRLPVGPSHMQLAIPLLILLLCITAFAFLLPHLSPTKAMAFGSAIVLFVVCLFSTKAALLILIFSMLLGPEFTVGSTTGASLGRGVTLRINDFVLVVVGFSWLAKMAINKRLGLFLHTPLNRPIAVYTVVCILTTGLGAAMGRVDLKTGFFYVLKYFEYMYVYFMAVNYLRTKRDFRLFVWAMLATAIIASIVGIVQIPGGGRITAPFEGNKGEPNTFGGYLMFMMAFAGGIMWHDPRLKRKILFGSMAVLFSIPLLYTGSRGSYLGVLMAGAAFAVFSRYKGRAFAFLGAAAILLMLTAPDIAVRRIDHTFTQGASRADVEEVMGVKLDTSSSARLRSWRQVMGDWVKQPLLGWGITGYGFLDGQYFRVAIETGLLGLIAFGFLLHRAWKVPFDIYRREELDPMERGVTLGLLCGFVGLLGHGLSANTFIIGRIMEPYWFTLALVVMIPHLTDSRLPPGAPPAQP